MQKLISDGRFAREAITELGPGGAVLPASRKAGDRARNWPDKQLAGECTNQDRGEAEDRSRGWGRVGAGVVAMREASGVEKPLCADLSGDEITATAKQIAPRGAD